MDWDTYFEEWQCYICNETAYVDTHLQVDEPFYGDYLKFVKICTVDTNCQ